MTEVMNGKPPPGPTCGCPPAPCHATGGGLHTALPPPHRTTPCHAGGDLYTALQRHPEALRWERLGRRVALDVALGLNHLHTRRPPLLHRDLKSPNVLLSGG